jgi:hypothetical protein
MPPQQARGRQSQIGRGEIPAELAGIIDQRAQEIRSGMQMSPVAGAVRTAATAVREADWSVNQQAYRAAVAHMMEGRTPDIEPFYDLHKPALRQRAIERIQNPMPVVDEGAVLSARAPIAYGRIRKKQTMSSHRLLRIWKTNSTSVMPCSMTLPPLTLKWLPRCARILLPSGQRQTIIHLARHSARLPHA